MHEFLCAYMHACVCASVCLCAFVHVCVCLHVCLCAYMCVPGCLSVCMPKGVCACLCVCMPMCACVPACLQVCLCVPVWEHPLVSSTTADPGPEFAGYQAFLPVSGGRGQSCT